MYCFRLKSGTTVGLEIDYALSLIHISPYDAEERILVPSPKVATYDLKPEMSAYEVKDKLVEAINTKTVSYTHLDVYKRQAYNRSGLHPFYPYCPAEDTGLLCR